MAIVNGIALESNINFRVSFDGGNLSSDGGLLLLMEFYYKLGVNSLIEHAVDLPLIAARAAISESECLRCFHDTIGIAPKQYVKRYRIQKAAELLTSTDGKIADIGARCGFLDTSYFTRAFHEVKGMTPGEFRQSYNGKWRVENGE